MPRSKPSTGTPHTGGNFISNNQTATTACFPGQQLYNFHRWYKNTSRSLHRFKNKSGDIVKINM